MATKRDTQPNFPFDLLVGKFKGKLSLDAYSAAFPTLFSRSSRFEVYIYILPIHITGMCNNLAVIV